MAEFWMKMDRFLLFCVASVVHNWKLNVKNLRVKSGLASGGSSACVKYPGYCGDGRQ